MLSETADGIALRQHYATGNDASRAGIRSPAESVSPSGVERVKSTEGGEGRESTVAKRKSDDPDQSDVIADMHASLRAEVGERACARNGFYALPPCGGLPREGALPGSYDSTETTEAGVGWIGSDVTTAGPMDVPDIEGMPKLIPLTEDDIIALVNADLSNGDSRGSCGGAAKTGNELTRVKDVNAENEPTGSGTETETTTPLDLTLESHPLNLTVKGQGNDVRNGPNYRDAQDDVTANRNRKISVDDCADDKYGDTRETSLSYQLPVLSSSSVAGMPSVAGSCAADVRGTFGLQSGAASGNSDAPPYRSSGNVTSSLTSTVDIGRRAVMGENSNVVQHPGSNHVKPYVQPVHYNVQVVQQPVQPSLVQQSEPSLEPQRQMVQQSQLRRLQPVQPSQQHSPQPRQQSIQPQPQPVPLPIHTPQKSLQLQPQPVQLAQPYAMQQSPQFQQQSIQQTPQPQQHGVQESAQAEQHRVQQPQQQNVQQSPQPRQQSVQQLPQPHQHCVQQSPQPHQHCVQQSPQPHQHSVQQLPQHQPHFAPRLPHIPPRSIQSLHQLTAQPVQGSQSTTPQIGQSPNPNGQQVVREPYHQHHPLEDKSEVLHSPVVLTNNEQHTEEHLKRWQMQIMNMMSRAQQQTGMLRPAGGAAQYNAGSGSDDVIIVDEKTTGGPWAGWGGRPAGWRRAGTKRRRHSDGPAANGDPEAAPSAGEPHRKRICEPATGAAPERRPAPAVAPPVGSARISHAELPPDILYMVCNLCGKSYGNAVGMKKHLLRDHEIEFSIDKICVKTISDYRRDMCANGVLRPGCPDQRQALLPPDLRRQQTPKRDQSTSQTRPDDDKSSPKAFQTDNPTKRQVLTSIPNALPPTTNCGPPAQTSFASEVFPCIRRSLTAGPTKADLAFSPAARPRDAETARCQPSAVAAPAQHDVQAARAANSPRMNSSQSSLSAPAGAKIEEVREVNGTDSTGNSNGCNNNDYINNGNNTNDNSNDYSNNNSAVSSGTNYNNNSGAVSSGRNYNNNSGAVSSGSNNNNNNNNTAVSSCTNYNNSNTAVSSCTNYYNNNSAVSSGSNYNNNAVSSCTNYNNDNSGRSSCSSISSSSNSNSNSSTTTTTTTNNNNNGTDNVNDANKKMSLDGTDVSKYLLLNIVDLIIERCFDSPIIDVAPPRRLMTSTADATVLTTKNTNSIKSQV